MHKRLHHTRPANCLTLPRQYPSVAAKPSVEQLDSTGLVAVEEALRTTTPAAAFVAMLQEQQKLMDPKQCQVVFDPLHAAAEAGAVSTAAIAAAAAAAIAAEAKRHHTPKTYGQAASPVRLALPLLGQGAWLEEVVLVETLSASYY